MSIRPYTSPVPLQVKLTCHDAILFREEFCEIFRAKDKSTMKMYTCKKFLKKDGRKVRKAAKNEILILKMWVAPWDSMFQWFAMRCQRLFFLSFLLPFHLHSELHFSHLHCHDLLVKPTFSQLQPHQNICLWQRAKQRSKLKTKVGFLYERMLKTHSSENYTPVTPKRTAPVLHAPIISGVFEWIIRRDDISEGRE